MESRKFELFENATKEMLALYKSKDADYGGSVRMTRKIMPNAILIRLYDKINRLKSLLESGKAPNNESIEDTLIDLANYAIIELIERQLDIERLSCSTNHDSK